MTFAAPAGLALLALAVPIVILHVLRPRREPVEVSSTWLWREMSRPVTSAAPWQRLRPSVLLLLQLAAVALLATAVARPVRITDAPLAPHTVFVVDASGSMAARDGSPERLDEAKDRARELRSQLPAGGVASIVVADADPHVALSASDDRRAFDDALRAVRSVAAPADMSTAFTLAASLETPGLPLGVVLLSDGRLASEDRGALLPGTRFEAIGSRAANRAITRLVVEPSGAGLRVIVVVRNTGGAATTETLRLDVDGRTAASARIDVPRGQSVEREFVLAEGDRVEAFLEGDDLLVADDHAYAVAGRRPPVRVLHVGSENPFLERLLAALPGVTVERSPAVRPARGFDLAIYDRVDPPAPLEAPSFVIAAPGGVPDMAIAGTIENPAIALVETSDPLLQGVDLSSVLVASAQQITAPRDQVLVASESGPLLVRGTRDGQPLVYQAFSLDESDLPLHVAFPVIGDRLVTELTGASVPPADVRVGQTLAVPAGATLEVPGGAVERFAAPSSFTTTATGFHVVRQDGRADRVVAVNADPAESTVSPERSVPIPEPRAGDARVPTRGERSLLPFAVAALLVVLALELLVSRRQIGVSRRQWRAGLAVRVVIVVALLGALVGFSVPRRGTGVATLFLIDASDSMGAGGRQQAIAWVRDALDQQPRNARAGVALFGGDSRLELTVQERAVLVQPATTIDASRTNLAGALRLAAAVLPSDAKRRIVVVSDGRATEGDAGVEADRLRRAGIDVDVHAVARTTGRDAALARLDAPTRASKGEAVPLRATVTSTDAGLATVTVERDGVAVEERLVDLVEGENVVEFLTVVGEEGVHRYSVRVLFAGDQIPENDRAFAPVEVEGPPRVLVVEGGAGHGDRIAAALRAGGLVVDETDAAVLPDVDRLAGYQSTVMVDVAASSLTTRQLGALTTATRDLGRGLVTIGGDNSYALGGYRDSELEALLPVISDVTDPKRRSSVAEVLALDTSGSMGACHCAEGSNGMATGGNRAGGGVNKTDIAKAGAARAIAALSESDLVGVLAFNDDQKMVLPLQTVPDDDVVQGHLDDVEASGATDVNAGLRRAARELRDAKAKLKHIILFTDGFTEPGSLGALAEQAEDVAAEGITVSVVATGEGASTELARVAEAGRGRFYAGRDLTQIPEILVQEAVLASRSFVNEGSFFPKIVGVSEAVRDLTSAPPLLGYIATTAKPAASTSLRIGEDEDPLLASWTTGLGRVTSWTSDASGRWSQQWETWDGYVGFWSAVVRETFPATGAGGVALRAGVEADRLRITLESESPLPEGTTVAARVTDPSGKVSDVRLERTSASTFVADVPALSAGAYAVGASVEGTSGEAARLSALASQSYAAEYRPGVTDERALRDVSERSGGRGLIEAGQAFDPAGLTSGRSRWALAGWLLALAALLWPVDVALRRLSLRSHRGMRPMAPPATPPAPPESPAQESPVQEAPAPEVVPAPVGSLGRLLERKRSGDSGGDRGSG